MERINNRSNIIVSRRDQCCTNSTFFNNILYLVDVELGQQQVGLLEVLSIVTTHFHLAHALQQIARLVLLK